MRIASKFDGKAQINRSRRPRRRLRLGLRFLNLYLAQARLARHRHLRHRVSLPLLQSLHQVVSQLPLQLPKVTLLHQVRACTTSLTSQLPTDLISDNISSSNPKRTSTPASSSQIPLFIKHKFYHHLANQPHTTHRSLHKRKNCNRRHHTNCIPSHPPRPFPSL